MRNFDRQVIKTISSSNAAIIKAYEDAHAIYEGLISGAASPFWDFVIITASCKAQAKAYEAQIKRRRQEKRLPPARYFVLPDKNDNFGSGNAVLHALRFIRSKTRASSFGEINSLIINSGGESRRSPRHSVSGKLFTSVPTSSAPSGADTLFDELLAVTCRIPVSLRGVTLVMAGDIFFVTDLSSFSHKKNTAMPLAVMCEAQTGTRHGVFLKGRRQYALEFLHKCPLETLVEKGAVDSFGNVLIDTGAFVLDGRLCDALYSFSSSGAFAKETDFTAVDFYKDFISPMAESSGLKSYLEASSSAHSGGGEDLHRALFDVLRRYRIYLNDPPCSAFYHLGTTAELRSFLYDVPPLPGWSRRVCANAGEGSFTAINSYVSPSSEIGEGTVIEDCVIGGKARIGRGCVISSLFLEEGAVGDDTVLHGLKLNDESHVVQKFGTNEDTKRADVWEAKRFHARKDTQSAVKKALCDKASERDSALLSFDDCLKSADAFYPSRHRSLCVSTAAAKRYVEAVKGGGDLSDFLERGGEMTLEGFLTAAQSEARHLTGFKKARFYLGLADALRDSPKLCRQYSSLAFSCVAQDFSGGESRQEIFCPRENVSISLPARVNFCGEWSDTIPYCTERGGKVLNAAVLIGGKKSVNADIIKTDTPRIRLTDRDKNKTILLKSWSDFDISRDDAFRLQKSCLKVCGVTQINLGKSLEEFLSSVGGFAVETDASNMPNSSGLGISSILCCAVLKALNIFFGREFSANELYNAVLAAEQLMGSGGGWQDTVGGHTAGFKLSECRPGIPVEITGNRLCLSPKFLSELNSRFCLVYSGPREKNKSVPREIMGRFIMSPDSYGDIIKRKSERADAFCEALIEGNTDRFGSLLDEQLDFCAKLSPSLITTNIDGIFKAADDLACGRMLCGAGGGGFVQIVLREGVPKEKLSEALAQSRLPAYVKVYDSSFLAD